MSNLRECFWRSFDEAGNTLDEHFSEFAEANDLSEEDVDYLRTDVITKLITYFAQMVENIHQAEPGEEGPILKIFDYFADDCFELDAATKVLLLKSIVASATAFSDDEGDDQTKVKKFLKALVKHISGPDKDYDDLAQDIDLPRDPYGNGYSGGVKVFDRKANRYGHGPNENTLLATDEFRRYAEKMVPGQNAASPAQSSLQPNSKPGYSHGLSVAHHAVSGLKQYCDDNDITTHHLGMGPGVQHFGFQNVAHRNMATGYLKDMHGRSSFRPFTRPTNEGVKELPVTSPLEEGLNQYGQKSAHDRLVRKPSSTCGRWRRSHPHTLTKR